VTAEPYPEIKMRFLAAALATALLATPAIAQAPAGAYAVDKTHTSLTWKVMHQGLSWYTARFTGVDIQLDFNPADVSKSKVTATIDPKSVETDFAKTRAASSNTDFNAELVNDPRFFNAAKFPQITFASTAISKTGDKAGKMTGNLTFLGVTKPVTLDVTFIGDRNDPRAQKHKVGFEATGSFKRSDFGMPGVGSAGDVIKIEVQAEFVQK
jgi:polyisoprenoid-binding protein YceI